MLVVVLLTLLVVMAGTSAGCRREERADRGPEAPAFTLPDLAAGEVSLASFRGRPVVLVFWGTT